MELGGGFWMNLQYMIIISFRTRATTNTKSMSVGGQYLFNRLLSTFFRIKGGKKPKSKAFLRLHSI